MEPILFYGVPEGCSFGSIVALEWSGRPYRLCRIQMPEVVSGEAYRQINPIRETPSLLAENGEVFSQSLAILQRIARSSNDPRMGPRPGVHGFDRLIEVLAFLNTTFFGAFSPLWQAFEGAAGAEKEALQAIGRKNVRKAHAQLETLLDGREWLVGDGPTIADAYFAGIARWNEFHQAIDRREFPAIDALYRRLQDDPAVRFAHAIKERHEARSAGGFRGEVSLEQALQRLTAAA